MIYDLAIIGGGPAGYTAAELGGKNGLKVVLFEKKELGGVCLNEGCIPTKTLLYSTKVFCSVQNAFKYGVFCEKSTIDLNKVFIRKDKVVRRLVAGIKKKMSDAHVKIVCGEAKIINSSVQIACNKQLYTAKKLMLCTGSEAIIPLLHGIYGTNFWTHSEVLLQKKVPASLLIIGGGVIGVEFASFFNALGVRVRVVEMKDEILSGADKEFSALLRDKLVKKGIEFYLNTKVISLQNCQATIEKEEEKQILKFSQLFISVGRKPKLIGYGLENLPVELSNGGVKVNAFMQTSLPNVYACGDVTGFSLLAHTAISEAETAVCHILGGRKKMSYSAIPFVVYTCPELASVGKTEEMLQMENIPYCAKKIPLTYSGRFIIENEQEDGLCKILEGENRALLGAHILGNPSSELITLAGIAIERGISSNELKNTVFPHPTVGEIFKEIL